MRKAIVIGVGGSGISVIRRVRELIEWRHNVRAEEVQFVRYIGLDTSLDIMGEAGGDFVHIRVPPDGITRALEERQRGTWSWMEPAIVGAAGAIEDGAGAVRMIGKFALFYEANLQRFLNMLEVRMRELKGLTNADIPDVFGDRGGFQGRVKVFVVANTVSGTGSGTFVDIGYLTRRFVTSGEYKDIPFELTAMVTLPDNLQHGLHAANSYHALKELNHWMGEHEGYAIDDPLQPGQRIRVPPTQRPFDFVYLVSRHRGIASDPVEDHKYLEDLIGEFIYQDIFQPLAQIRDGRRDDYRWRFIVPDRLGYYPRFSSFGLATIEYPIVQIARGCTYRWLTEMINQWLNMSGPAAAGERALWASAAFQPAPPPVDNTPYLRVLSDANLAEGDLRRQGSLWRALSAPVDIGGETVDIVRRYEDLIQRAVNGYRGDVRDLDAVELQITRGFRREEFVLGRERGPFPLGIVVHTILHNEERLRASLPEVLTRQCADLVFGSGGLIPGPYYARTYLDRVQGRFEDIAAGRGGIQDQSVLPTLQEEMDAAKHELYEIETDFVLTSPMDSFRIVARHGALERYRRAAIAYFDALFTSLLMEAGRRLAEELSPTLGRLRRRVANFEEYVARGVRAFLIMRYAEATRPRRVNGYDFLAGDPEAEITRRYEELAPRLQRPQRAVQAVRDLRRSALARQLEVDLRTLGMFDGDMALLRNPRAREGEPAYRFRREFEDELVVPVRQRLLSALGEEDVLVRFLQQGGQRADVQQVHTLAGVFIDAIQGDENFYYDPYVMLKRWFAYPGGENLTEGPPTPPVTPVHEFAQCLRDAVGDVKWADESVGVANDQMAVFLVERGAFPMRFLAHLDTAMRQAAARRDHRPSIDGWVFPNPGGSRVDVDFLPLEVRDRQRLREARNLFLAAVAARVLVVDATIERFRLAGPAHVLPGGAGALGSLPRSPNSAAARIYANEGWQRELERRIRAFREAPDHGDHELVVNIAGMIEHPRGSGLAVSDEEQDPVRQAMAASILWGYVKRDAALLQAWEQRVAAANLGASLSGERTDIRLVEEAQPLEGHPSPGFYCRICNAYLGYPRDAAGNPDPWSVPECWNAAH